MQKRAKTKDDFEFLEQFLIKGLGEGPTRENTSLLMP